MNTNSIGFFDSGVGGLTVLKTAMALLPGENFIYYGDTENAPYGSKETEEIQKLTQKGIEFLLGKGVKALVIACNTATSAAVDHTRNVLRIPVISMEPAIKPALAAVEGAVLMMATPSTVARTRYQQLLARFDEQGRVINLPCPYLASEIEKSLFTPGRIRAHLEELLAPYQEAGVEAVVLGCTHYVLVKHLVQEIMPYAQVFDGNEGTARRLAAVLAEKNLLSAGAGAQKGTVALYSSSESPETTALYHKILYGEPEVEIILE